MKPINRTSALVASALLGLSLLAAANGRMSSPSPTAPPSDEGQPVTRGLPPPPAPASDRAVPPARGLTRQAIPSADERARQMGARMRDAGAGSTESTLRSLNARVQADQKAAIDAENAKVQAELAKLRGSGVPAASSRLEAIRREALAIQNRQATASAEQKAKDAARFNELYAEYERLAR